MYTGPNIVRDGLVFGYDADDRSTRFYPGEPTTNILPNPDRNGRFSTLNAWGTYNTNQYNSATFFNIGVISDITNNIVTLSSVNHAIRSFDILRPQTTGGGVIANTNYVIKKITSTTFSLHLYNGSQNGSQGYTNPDTGFFKVHDAYATDTRININATSFPTMWWGAPHLPNSGLIKEIVTDGGRIKGTNCMRLHIYRGDNVSDGMAYGVNCSVTIDDVITVSFWVKAATSNAIGKTPSYSTYFGPGKTSGGGSYTLTNEWQLIQFTWTASATYSFFSYFWSPASTDKYSYDMSDLQVELNKGHATPFTLSSRSTIQGLLDLAGNTTIDLSNVSFDSSSRPIYNGAEFIDTGWGNGIDPSNTQFTLECVVKANSTNLDQMFIATTNHGTSERCYFATNGGYWRMGIQSSGWSGGNVLVTTKYTHIIITLDGNSANMYINGVYNYSKAYTSYNLLTNFNIGRGNGYNFNGEIPIAKIYNKALTQSEITQNFNAYKTRFGL